MKNQTHVKLLILNLILMVTTSCGEKKNSASEDKYANSNIKIVLKSTDESSFSPSGISAFSGSNCNVNTDMGGSESGKCYTPLYVKGVFNMASISSTQGGPGARILGGGTEVGLESVFKKAEFDLKNSPELSGEDNLQDSTNSSFNLVSLSVQAIEYAFRATSSNKFYYVRIPFVTTPPSASSAFSSCGLDGGLTEADSLGTLYTGLTAYPGDILVCVKTSSSESCSDSDYQWIDNQSLTSTRPASPKKLSGTYLMSEDSCTQGADHPELTWGSTTLDILLSSPVSVSASIDQGVKTYSSNGTSGNKLEFSLDIDTASALFVPSSAISSDLATATESEVLNHIGSIQIKPIYIKNRKNNPSPGTGDMTASAAITISNE